MNTYSKQEVARRQLGTALHLFLKDCDPVSVHCLACGGAELSDHLANERGEISFSQHALSCYPSLATGQLTYLRNRYWNAMKHATRVDGKLRDDDPLLAAFSDQNNDHILFIGWYDYSSGVGILPIEAQVFQVWYFANFPEKLAEAVSPETFEELFPGIREMDRRQKKAKLREKVEWARQQADIMNDERTDKRPLMMRS